MKVDIKKELENSRNKSIDHAEENLQDVKLLLDGRAQKEREVLKEAGLYHNIAKIESEQSLNLDRKKFEGEFGEVMFTKEEVKQMCIKYHLKFLSSKYFKGHVDPQLGAKILRFFEKNPSLSPAHEASNNMFIMAPVRAFNLEDKIFEKDLDPVIFLRVQNKAHEEFFVMIHKWGNDFTIIRYIKGLINRNYKTAWLFWGTVYGCIIASIFPFVVSWSFIITFLVSLVLGFGIQLVWFLKHEIGASDDSYSIRDWKFFQNRYSVDGWNTQFSGKLKHKP